MNQKLTALSLASLLLLAPVHSSFAQSDTSSASTSDSGASDTSSASTSDSGSSDTSSASTSDSGASDTSSASTSDSGSSDTSSASTSDSGASDTSSASTSDSGSRDTSSNSEVMNLSQSVEEFRSKVDPAAYEQYLKEEQAAMALFTVKENVDYNSIINEFQQSLAVNPDNNNLYVELALAYLANGDLNNAEEIAKQLDAKAPETYLSLILQAELAGSQGKTDEKQLYLEQAVEKNPTSAVARFKLGEELTKVGKPTEAIAQLSTSAALNPENPLVFEELNKAFAQTNNTELKTFVNGVVPKFEINPFIENGFTLVPARAIAESLGANVEWNDATQQVTIQRGETTIQLTNESNVAIVNGQEVTIDAPAKIVNDNTVLPLRFVAESLGAKVDWKAESRMIVISE